MRVSSQLKGGIYEVSFGYNPKMEGYTTLMSDIQELSEIADAHKLAMTKAIFLNKVSSIY